MAIGRISGPMLQSNLERQGLDLSIETDLLYFDVTNNRIGVRTAMPSYSLDVLGNGQIGNIVLDSGNISPLITNANLSLSGNGTGIVVVVGNLDVGNIATANITTANVSTITGDLTLSPVAGSNVQIQSNVSISSSEDSSSTTTGALVLTGGAGIGGNLYVSSILNVAGTDVLEAISAVSAQLLSVDDKLSNAISAVADSVSVVSASLVSTNDILSALSSDVVSIDTKLSNAISAVAADLGSAVSDLHSAVDTISNQISVILTSSTTFSGATYSFTGNTPSTDVSTGAVVIQGGLGVSDNIFANIVTAVSEVNAGSLTLSTDTLANNNIDGNIVVQPNGDGIVNISTDTAVIMPAGPDSSRPAGATAGYTRYNTSSGYLEYYNGSSWINASSSQGLLTLDIYTGDNSTTTFTASQVVPAENYIVTLNGVIQLPYTAYTVSGADIQFAEAPTNIDTVEIRSLNTLLMGSGPKIANAANNTRVDTEQSVGDNKVRITVAGTQRVLINSDVNLQAGTNFTYDQTAISAGTGNTIVDSFTTSSYRSAKYFVQVSNGTDHQVFDAMVLHNSTVPFISSSTLYTNASLGTLGVDMVGSTVQLIFVGSGAGNQVKVHRTLVV